MEWTTAKARFAFLADAYTGSGGFRPSVEWVTQAVRNDQGEVTGSVSVPSLMSKTELVRYSRESDTKFAARNAVAVYDNHLEDAVGRFVGFLGRKLPQRDGTESPLVKLMVDNADLKGTPLDMFMLQFAADAKARGSMLLVIDTPTGAPATSLADQIQRRRVPYVRSALPESVVDYLMDAESGLFLSITLASRELWEGKVQDVERDYTTEGWRVRKAKSQVVLSEGAHTFGACQVLAFTEDGSDFPRIGRYAQIADLSRRLFNARSERDEILRSQTFSLLTLQVPPEQAQNFDATKVGATIGTHSMLVHGGDQPAFIAPDSGPAETYAKNIAELESSIMRIQRKESTESSTQAESGEAKRLRFEELNSELATFARQLQVLESRMWSLFMRSTKAGASVSVVWPDDFNLADVMAELDVLDAMARTGFPEQVLVEKRKSIAAAEFDGADGDTKARIKSAIDEQSQAVVPPGDAGQQQ